VIWRFQTGQEHCPASLLVSTQPSGACAFRRYPPILLSQFRKGVLQDMANSILATISSEFASAAEKVGSSVVAVHARRWMPTSGIEWKRGVVITVHHGVQRDEDIQVLLGAAEMRRPEIQAPASRDRSHRGAVR
jgi:hypothetical protein